MVRAAYSWERAYPFESGGHKLLSGKPSGVVAAFRGDKPSWELPDFKGGNDREYPYQVLSVEHLMGGVQMVRNCYWRFVVQLQ